MMTIDLTIADGEAVSERHSREALERDDALAADDKAKEKTMTEPKCPEECDHPVLDSDCVCKSCGEPLGLSRDQIAAREPKLREGREEPSDLELATSLWEAMHGLKWGTLAADARPYRTAPADYLPAARAAKSSLLGARRVAVPTREQIARAAFDALPPDDNTWDTVTQGTRDEWLVAADAVLRLLFADAKAPGCACTHEAGDSACPLHPTCGDCGEPATAPEYLCARHSASKERGR